MKQSEGLHEPAINAVKGTPPIGRDRNKWRGARVRFGMQWWRMAGHEGQLDLEGWDGEGRVGGVRGSVARAR
jgi:hypothetical protein